MKRLTLTLLHISISLLAIGQALQIEMDNYTAVPSEGFCLAFKVNNFDQIVSSQYTVQWDPAVISFDALTNVGLPYPGNLFYNTAFINQGQLLVNWFDSFGNGNDLPDGTIMYELCFTAVGPVGSTTTLEFTNLPLQIEVTNTSSGGMDIGLEPSGGTVTIVEPLEIISSLSHPDCNNPGEGSVETIVSGGTAPYNYSWTGPNNYNSTNEDISNLASGTYYLSITDSSIPPLTLTDTFEIESSISVPLVLLAPGGTITCADTLITLDASGSSQGFNYEIFWLTTNGNIVLNGNTLNPVVDEPGDYQLIISNIDNGCTASAMTTVAQDTVTPIVVAGMNGHIDCDLPEIILDGSGSSSGPEFSPLWSTQDGNILNGQNTSEAMVNGAGTYTLLVVDNTNGCSASDQVMVTIDTISPIADAGMNQIQNCYSVILDLDGTASSSGVNFTYEWSTNNGNLLNGETSLSPQVDEAGNYILLVTNMDNGCTATDLVVIDLDENLQDADAGLDENICEDVFMLQANLPDNNSGLWSYSGSAQIEQTNINNTMVFEIPGGLNEFVWTLSTDDCPNYSSDTIVVTVEAEPIANDDQFTVPFGINPYSLDLIANDGILTLTDFEVSILNAPVTGTLNETMEGQFEFNYPSGFFGPLEFEYTICNNFCPDYCDTALVMLNVLDEIRIDTTVEITNAFTPNDDGINDTFVIPVLENNPGAYPDNEIIFFNRWGNIVHQAKPYLNDWRGTNSSGKTLPQGTYYYVLRLDINQGEIIKGDVTILR